MTAQLIAVLNYWYRPDPRVARPMPAAASFSPMAPANTILSLGELNAIFQDLTVSMLGRGTPAGPTDPLYRMVRIAWPTEGQPGFGIAEDVTFVSWRERYHVYNQIRESQISQFTDSPGWTLNRAVHYTRMIDVRWVIYGPNSYANSQLIRDGLFSPEGRAGLKAQNLYLTGAIPTPNRAPELFEGQWWERVDMNAMFNELVILNYAVPSIKTVDVMLQTDTGITETISITGS